MSHIYNWEDALEELIYVCGPTSFHPIVYTRKFSMRRNRLLFVSEQSEEIDPTCSQPLNTCLQLKREAREAVRLAGFILSMLFLSKFFRLIQEEHHNKLYSQKLPCVDRSSPPDSF
mmetsp:Transcript_20003/g.43129  ORF Transcript_20003/g.43129 Transcript_20003/m.43129 type:complete len:116 (-) Transcript_20003:1632-1979(-)